MLEIQKIHESGFFQIRNLKEGEYLFHEGETDDNLYIVQEGELEIQKKIVTQNYNYKNLGKITEGSIVGEGSFFEKVEKKVSIKANSTTTLLFINAQQDFKRFNIAYPLLAQEILLHIINITNSRLNESNNEITASYEISSVISQMKQIHSKSINVLLDTIQYILGVEQIIFIEKNVALDDYFIVRYDSGEEKKIKNTVLNFKDKDFSVKELEKNDIAVLKHVTFTRLILGDINYGYIIISRNQNFFNENEEKILQNIATSFVGVIRQKEIQKDQKNKLSLKNNF